MPVRSARLRLCLVLVPLAGLWAVPSAEAREETGIMAGEWKPPGSAAAQPVTVAWQARRRTEGQMTFTLGPGGERFEGSYLLIEKTTAKLQVQPMYQAWQAFGIQDGAVPGTGWLVPAADVDWYVQRYDGHVVASLTGDRGDHARCRFDLADTGAGIPGGGTGECQLSDGGSLSVRF